MPNILLEPGSASRSGLSINQLTSLARWTRWAMSLAIGSIALVGNGLAHAACPVENFDSVAAPDLPAGWTFSTAPNNTGAGTFGTVTTAFDTAPNAAFSPDFVPLANSVNDVRLTSPAFVPESGDAFMFRNQWNMRTNTGNTAFYDGGVLEISVNDGPYVDIIAAGGGFVSGGYNLARRIVTSSPTPLANRFAWAGNGGGSFVDSVVAMPPASIGQSTRLRFRTAIAAQTSIQVPATAPGWWVDSLSCTAAPPMLTQAFAPTSAAVGAVSTLTLSLSYPSGGATLSSALVDTLPVGLSVAATPNASTTCPGGVVSTTAGSLTLAAGAQIPAAGCTVSVDVSAAAPGIFTNDLPVGALQTSAGANPAATSENYQATQAGVQTYVTGFEAPTYALGNLNFQDGWSRSGFATTDVKVVVNNPLQGSQHLRIQTALPDGSGYKTYTSQRFPAGTTEYSVATLNVAFPTVGTPAPFEFGAQDLDAASALEVPITKVRFNSDFAIQVLDSTGTFVNTGATWAQGSTYRQVRIVTRRADSSVLVCLDGNSIYTGAGAAANTRNVTFALQRQPGMSTNIWDIDNVGIDNRNFGGCADVPALAQPTIAMSFAPTSVATGINSTASITLNNPNATPITLSAPLVDALPANLVANSAATTCAGTASFTAGTLTLASGATIPAHGSCTLSGAVQSAIVGNYVNSLAAGSLQTDAGSNFLDASAGLEVTLPPITPTVTTSFAPAQVGPNEDTTARIFLSNQNAFAITLSADLVDTLPGGLVATAASTTCGGTASFSPGTLQLLSGATIPANETCILQGTVHATGIGNFVNTIQVGGLQTSAGNNETEASATLVVVDTSGSVTLEQTVGTDLSAGACSSVKSLIVETRTPVNFCYRLTNNTQTTLNYQTVRSSTFGRLQNYQNIVLAPGQTHQFNDIRTLASDVVDSAVWNGDDTLANYTQSFNDGSVAWDDISTTGAIFVNNITSSIAFPFPYFAELQTTLDFVDGGLAFGRANASFPFTNTDLPSADANMPLTVLPYWDRWSSTSGTLYWQVKGSAPNRRLITQWHDRKFTATNPNGIRYQVVLFEATGEIAFLYNQVDNGVTNPGDTFYQYSFGKSATIGLSFDSTRASKFSYFPDAPDNSSTPVVNNGDSLVFSPTSLIRFTDNDAVAVTVVSPDIVVDESPIAVLAAGGSAAQHDLVIGNSGTSNLNWVLDPAQAAGTHVPRMAQTWPDRAALGVNPDGSLDFASPTGVTPVPGYVYTLSVSGFTLASMDVNNPQVLNTIATLPQNADFDVTGLEFVGADFSSVYTLGYSNGAFQSLDTTTGAATLIGYADADESGINEGRQDMAYDPVSGMLYALTLQTTNPSTINLYTIDPLTGMSTFAAALQGMGNNRMNAIGINGQGQMYGIDYTQDRLIAIDKATGLTSVVGPLGFNASGDQSLEYDDATDTMYWVGGIFISGPNVVRYQVFTMNTETGAATLIGDFGSDPLDVGTSGLAIPQSNPCMLPSEIPWMSFSDSSGVVGPTDTDTVHIAFDSTGLADGDYSALICLGSNDPISPRIRIPVTMTVSDNNTAPMVTCTPADFTFSEGDSVNLDFSTLFIDVDGDALTYAMNGAPASLSLNPNTGLLSGTLLTGDSNGSPYVISVTAQDPQNASANTMIDMIVLSNGDALFGDGFDGAAPGGVCQ